MPSKIEWTNETWNPVIGCSKISEGCENCYAEKMAFRLAHMEWSNDYRKLNYCNVICPDTKKWTGKTQFVKEAITKPLEWKKPRKIFVCSMGDLFHETISFESIDMLMAIITCSPQHTFQILTKRPERMLEYFTQDKRKLIEGWEDASYEIGISDKNGEPDGAACYIYNRSQDEWPLKNIWLGVTCENQQRTNERLPVLLKIPAAKKFISCEPLLGDIDFYKFSSSLPSDKNHPWRNEAILFGIDWLIVGGETGTNASPMHPDWARNLKYQCIPAKVPFFFKGWGEYAPHMAYLNKSIKTVCHNTIEYNMCKVGKTKSGSLLDGVEYNEMPK